MVCEGVGGVDIRVNGTTTLVKADANISAITLAPPATAPNLTFSSVLATVTVEQGAQVANIRALVPADSYGWARIAVTNGGTITALNGTSDANGRFERLVNLETGVIGTIRGQVSLFSNLGLIDGGAQSAYIDAPSPQYGGQGTVANSGTIRSTSTDATIRLYRAFNPDQHVANTGLIENMGTGYAIEGVSILNLTNGAGGRIESKGTAIFAPTYVNLTNVGSIRGDAAAIRTNGSLQLTNRGTITGDLVATGAGAFQGARIDNRGGTINGNVLLGAGNDVFLADLTAANPLGIINGTVDTGGGTDAIRFEVITDTVLQSAIALPGGFEQIQIGIGKNSTLTLGESYAGTSAIAVGGGDQGLYNPKNKFINLGRLDTTGQALSDDAGPSSGLTIANQGMITATLAKIGDVAVKLNQTSYFSNAGSIIGNGGGGILIGSGDHWDNSGSIVATGTAVQSAQVVNNSGIIRSTSGLGADLTGFYSKDSINSGTIEGATIGARLYYSSLRNSGIISSAGKGVEMSYGAILRNEAGGTISGGQTAIGAAQSIGGARVFNQGTVNGNVFLGNAAPSGNTGNIYVAQPGGVLNGNLYLGDGNDLFVTALANNGPGAYAGVTGQVTGGGQQSIRYIVDQDASATISVGGVFSKTGYELLNGAKLTLTAPAPLGFALGLAGSGSVDINADFIGDGTLTLVDMREISVLSPPPSGMQPTNALDVMSRGTISVTQANPNNFFIPTVAVIAGSRFENAGTIIAHAASGGKMTVIQSDATVVNSGTILLDGATAVGSLGFGNTPRTLINSGLIEQIAGGQESRGVEVAGTVLNSGTISTGGNAISFGNYELGSLTNEGIVRSASGLAVTGDTYASGRIVNKAGGMIATAPGRDAILLGGRGVVDNAGTIIGNVLLGSASSQSAYYDRGGSLTGNLVFGAGEDLLVTFGDQIGITGTIDGGAGNDMFARFYNASATVNIGGMARPTNFESVGVGAIGAGTTVTITGSADALSGEIGLFGDGTVVNRAIINSAAGGAASRVLNFGVNRNLPGVSTGSTLAFVNEGTMGDGAVGVLRSFTNRGTITAGNRQLALSLGSATSEFLFANEGTIRSNPASGDAYDIYLFTTDDTDLATVRNSGDIKGVLAVSMTTRRFQFDNSGTLTDLTGNQNGSGAVQISLDSPFSFPADPQIAEEAVIGNSGKVTGGMDVEARVDTLAVTNSGTITNRPSGLALSVQQSMRAFADVTDQHLMTFANSGIMDGRVGLLSSSVRTTISNSGSIRDSVSDQISLDASAALSINSITGQAGQLSFTNSGTIVQDRNGASAVVAGAFRNADAGDGTSTVAIVNSGTIAANGGGYYLPVDPNYYPGFPFPNPNAPPVLEAATGLTVWTSRATASSLTIDNLANGVISASGGIATVNGATVPPGLDGLSAVALFGSADTATITNLGTIRGGAGGMLPDGLRFNLGSTDDFIGGAIQLVDSTDTVINGATGLIVGSISLGLRDDRLENAGRIEGDVYMGAGDDVVTMHSGAVFTGRVLGGEGTDRLELNTGTAYAAPTEVALDRFATFETFANLAGVNAYSGSGAIAQTNVSGGWLIGRAGSVLTGNVAVGSGARFGTAGTVNGNVSVAAGGILEPGASPGTMTVNGNLALAGGSTTHIELSANGVSDLLVVNGTLAIASGAALSLTSDTPLTPGKSYNFISATNTTGSFTTITQSATVSGAVRIGPTGASLIATFATPAGVPGQASRSIGYVNDLIISGQASSALVSAFPMLLNGGGGNPAAFAMISGEAYASASQFGIENGLSVARAMRTSFALDGQGKEGPFTFGQALGAWRTLDGDAAMGTSRATSRSGGLLGGLGLRRGDIAVGGFIGYADGNQTIGALGARTSADGVIAGLQGQLTADGFMLTAGVAYDWSRAATRRNLPGGSTANSSYRLRGLVADLSAGYRLAIGRDWAAEPGIGLTHVSSRRGAALESGTAAFALAVDGRRTKATFLDAHVAVRGGQGAGAAIQPWVEAGFRHQVAGRQVLADAGFVGSPRMGAIAGVLRAETSATAGAGLVVRATDRLQLQGSYRGEYGNGAGHAVSVGASLMF